MILRCSAGHQIDTESLRLDGRQYKKPGDKCGEIVSYDRVDGTVYCQRRLKEVIKGQERY